MARILIEAPLTTPSARSALAVGTHWRRIDGDTHLGYRKGKRSGSWLVRWRSPDGYRQEGLGTADDTIKAGNLTFAEAQLKARKTIEAMRVAEIAKADGEAPTVRSAVEAYVAVRNRRDSDRKGREVRSDADQRLRRYVLGIADVMHASKPGVISKPGVAAAPLAALKLHELKEPDLKAWVATLPSDMKVTSKERLCSDLRAALNAAYDAAFETLPPSVPIVTKRGLRLEKQSSEGEDDADVARDNQILSDSQIFALLNTARQIDDESGRWEGDLFRLMSVLAATGMRFSQVSRMRVRDVQRSLSRLRVPPSRKGNRLGKVPTPINVAVGEDLLDLLQPAVTGRAAGDTLLERWRYGQAPGSIEWVRDKRGPWLSSSEFSRDWAKIKTRAGLPWVDPYCFRHSSIVRKLRQGLSIRHAAALHDTSVVMIERHYAAHIVDGLEELAAKAVVPLIPPPGSNVVKIGGQR